ncbi:MAG: right-handed parallel beta-helix repeat-containing protein [Victivallales bacterium]|nr:right-handed parallel beta-helix repeat-containing protein [Victivallales bacterium]
MKRELFVSPDGTDWWSGDLPRQSSDGLNGPVVSLNLAILMARQWHRNGQSDGPVTVWLTEGHYPITFPLEFGPEDYGTMEFKALPGARPVIDGGVTVRNWNANVCNGLAVWEADMTAFLLEFGPFRSLFVNGSRRRRARYPSAEYLWIEEAPDAPPSGNAKTANMDLLRGSYRFRAAKGDVDGIASWEGAEVVMLNRWINERMPVRHFDPDTRIIEMDTRTCLFLRTEFAQESKTIRYWIENVREGLREPGDWYLDAAARKLYYVPCKGETPENCEVTVPAVKQFVRILGDLEHEKPAGGIRFEGITFAHADWAPPCNRPVWWDPYLPEHSWRPRTSFRHFKECNHANPWIDSGGSPQAAFNLPGAIQLEAARDVTITDCHILHVGFYGIGIGEACSTIRVTGNTISDMGAGGVLMDGTDPLGDPRRVTGHSVITDNHIHGGGHVFLAACGVTLVHTEQNDVSHNHIHDMTYSGISCGWMWGLADSVSRLHRIAHNHIHDLGRRGGMSDMGGIYLLGPQPGTFVDGNYIHDITSAAYGGWGIYPDEGSSMLTIENNVILRTGSESLHEHMGRQNVIRNNLFLLGGEGGVRFSRYLRNRWMSFPTEGGEFIRNVVLTDSAPVVRDMLCYQDRNPYAFDCNLYWDRSKGSPSFVMVNQKDTPASTSQSGRKGLAGRRKQGMDIHSIAADPRLRNIDGAVFTIASNSPLHSLGILPLDLSNVGPRPPDKRLTQHNPHPYHRRKTKEHHGHNC